MSTLCQTGWISCPRSATLRASRAGAIRAGDLKLIEFFDGTSPELYDLEDDIAETTNLAEKMPQKAQQLRRMLADWRRSVGARMPRPNPEHDPARAAEWWSRRTNRPLDIEAMEQRYRSRAARRP